MGNPLEFLQDNIFYTPEKIQQINTSQRESAARTGTKKSASSPTPQKKPNFLQENIFYTPETIQQINEAQRDSAARNRQQRESRKQSAPSNVPEGSTKRTRYSAGSGGSGWGSQEYADNWEPDTSDKRRNQRRGTGARNQAPPVINLGQGITVGSGVQGGRWAAKNKPKMASFGPDYAEQELELSAAAEKSTPVSEAILQEDRPTAPTEINTDESTIINSNGMRQSGRNLGYRSTITKGEGNTPYLEGEGGLFDRLGLGTGTQINRGWASTQLPGTETALYGGKPVSNQLGEGEQNLVLSKDLDQDGGAVRNLESMPQEAFEASQKGGESGGGQRNWMEKGPEDAKMARRRAFLDAPNSMAGMRAVDAQLGRVRSGNDFYYANPNQGQEGADEFIKVSLADGRKHQNDQISGQQLLNQYVTKIKEENVGNPDAPAPMEFSPDMSEEQFVDFQSRGGSQRSLEDTEIEDFINYQN